MNVLVCIDHSEASAKTVRFVAKMFGMGSARNGNICLFHVAELLPDFVLSDNSEPGMTPKALADQWADRAKAKGDALLAAQRDVLLKSGVPEGSVVTHLHQVNCLPEARKVAAALTIIDEMKSKDFDVICLGRRGASEFESSFVGSVAEKVVREARGKTVWLVD